MDAEFVQECYDKNHVLSSCNDIILEAKRVILNEQLEKIANITLSHLNHSQVLSEKYTDECQNKRLEELPLIHLVDENSSSIIDKEAASNKNSEISECEQLKKTNREFNLVKKYFEKWKTAVNREKQCVLIKEIQERKLNLLIDKLKNIKTEGNFKYHEKYELNSVKSRSSYKNRFIVQKNIIDVQKSKLEEQNKIIEELKLGIMREDILKSIENTKINIREIFASCSEKIKCKIPAVLVEEHKFSVSIQKAPKIIQQMEERALERARNREIILERKKLIEEIRQKMLEEAIEKKRVLEEEERKKTLELMKEKRKRELEQEKIRQEKRKIYEVKLNIAIEFHNRLLKEQCLRKLYNNVIYNREKELTAIEHHRKKVLMRSMNYWLSLVESLYLVKYETADAHFSYKILRKCMNTWKEARIDSIRNMQVAEDLYDFRLTSNIFIHWHRYVCKQIMLEVNKMKVSENHYKRRLLFHCFYQWRSLKAVLELEKAKDLKKQKWREKVWEILPDYKPPEDIY